MRLDHLLPRRAALVPRDGDSPGHLSTSTIIIIAVVAGSVVLLVFVLFLWRNLLRACRRSRTVPLPPVRDLAHHREQQHQHQQALSAVNASPGSRPATWVDDPLFHPRAYSAHFLSATASNTSLIRSSPDLTTNSRSPTREGSWAVDDPSATSAEGSPLSTDDLRAPMPSYFPAVNPHNSMASVASDATSDTADALATTPSELNASVESSASLLHNAHPPVPAVRPRPSRASRSRSRPLSMVSSAGTTHSLQTSHSLMGMNTLRGPAHSIHSNIQIVLPAPLAPELYPAVRPTDDRISVFGFGAGGGGSTSRVNSFYGGQPTAAAQGGGEGDRKSVADPWLSGALAQSRTSVALRGVREGSPSCSGSSSSARGSSAGPRPNSASRPRSSLSKMASASSLGDSAHRRAQSQPPAPPPLPTHVYAHSHSPSTSPGPSRPPSAPPANAPPVPRMPVMYEHAGAPHPISEEGYPHPQPQPQSYPYAYPHPHPQQAQGHERYAYEEQQSQGVDEVRGRPGPAYAPIPLPAGAAQPVRDPLLQLHMAALGSGAGMDMGRGLAAGEEEARWAGRVDRPPPSASPEPVGSSPASPTGTGTGAGARRQPSKLRKQRS